MSLTAWVVNALLLVALVALAGLFWRVQVRLQTLLRSSERLPALSNTLATAIEKAHSGLQLLQRSAQEQVPALNDKLRLAQASVQELSFLLERAERVAQRLEELNRLLPAAQLVKPLTAAAADVVDNVVELTPPVNAPKAAVNTPHATALYTYAERMAARRRQTPDELRDAELELRRALQEIL